jgi:hypothetical protein
MIESAVCRPAHRAHLYSSRPCSMSLSTSWGIPMMAARSRCDSRRRTRSRRRLSPSRQSAALTSSTTPAPSQKRQRSVAGRHPPAPQPIPVDSLAPRQSGHVTMMGSPPNLVSLSRSSLNGIAPNIFFPTLAIFTKRDGEGGIRLFVAQLPMSVATQLKKPCHSAAVRQHWRGDLEQSNARWERSGFW